MITTRHLLLLAFIMTLAGCAAPGGEKLQNSEIGYQRNMANIPVSPYINTRWHVVLAAMGNEQTVFDNFVDDFNSKIKDEKIISSIHTMYSTDKNNQPKLTYQEFKKTIEGIKPSTGEGCFIYMTGHGNKNGIVFSGNDPKIYVEYNYMEQLLEPCAGHPTVVVFSACFSGEYMRKGIARPERIIITASDANHPSFGCSNNNTYTFFDQCFIDEWKKSTTWENLADGVKICVNNKEGLLKFSGSNPQVFLGRDMRELPLPVH